MLSISKIRLNPTYLLRERDNSWFPLGFWCYCLGIGVLDTLVWAFAAQMITGFTLAVWTNVSLSFTLQKSYVRSSIIGAILHDVPK